MITAIVLIQTKRGQAATAGEDAARGSRIGREAQRQLVEQKIEVFESETQLPLDLALMIDSSLSAHKELAFEQEAAAHFIRQVLRPSDRMSVFAVDENITQLAGFSDNVASLQAAVHRMPAGSGTSIYDAVLLGSRTLGRRGEDRNGLRRL